jgi:hypothetical protein
MKKIILLIALTLIATFTFAQSYNKVYKATYIQYINGRWVDGEYNYPDNMYIILNKNNIRITNNKNASYITYGSSTKKYYDGFECSSWDCYDVDGKSLTFIMKYFYEKKLWVMMFVYNGYGYEYITE